MRYSWYVRGLVLGILAGLAVARIDEGEKWMVIAAGVLSVGVIVIGAVWALADDENADDASPVSRTPPS